MNARPISPAEMPEALMKIQVRTPTRLVVETEGIVSVKCETDAGRRTIEPRRLDGVVALAPGVLTMRGASGNIIEAAIDEGLLVKTGSEVTISVRHVILAEGKESLRHALSQEMARIRNTESDLRIALASLETRFMKDFSQVHRHE